MLRSLCVVVVSIGLTQTAGATGATRINCEAFPAACLTECQTASRELVECETQIDAYEACIEEYYWYPAKSSFTWGLINVYARILTGGFVDPCDPGPFELACDESSDAMTTLTECITIEQEVVRHGGRITVPSTM